jgi:hypothetical protein
VTVLGLINTVAFNVMLGRSTAFDPDQSLAAWFRWGVASTFPPLFYTSIWALILTLVAGMARLAQKLVPSFASALSRFKTACVDRIAERGLDEPAFTLQLVTGVGLIALTVLVWAFWDYGAGLITSLLFVNDAPVDRLAALQPGNEYRVDVYGLLLDLLLLLYGVATLRVLAWARRRDSRVSRPARLAALIVPVFALVLWQLPYRLMYQSAFERVDLSGVRCYALGHDGARLLLHCPDTDPPRNRIVSSGDTRLRRRGVVENMFMPAQLSQPTQ